MQFPRIARRGRARPVLRREKFHGSVDVNFDEKRSADGIARREDAQERLKSGASIREYLENT
jgi:hypothetical protein